MKKAFKIAGAIAGIAALASLVPYSIHKDEEEDTTTIRALLWKYTNQPDSQNPGSRKVSIDIGFHNPMSADNEDLLMDDGDELILVEAPVEQADSEEEAKPTDYDEGECIPF